jgi:hypothetical protein
MAVIVNLPWYLRSAVLIAATDHHWPHYFEKYGVEEEIVMSRFEIAHPAALAETVVQCNSHCDIRHLAAFEQAAVAVHSISTNIPEIVRGIHPAKEEQEKGRVSSGCIGAITYPAGQV